MYICRKNVKYSFKTFEFFGILANILKLFQILMVKFLESSDQNVAKIRDLMKLTFEIRRASFKKDKDKQPGDIKKILFDFPKLFDLKGQLVSYLLISFHKK